MKNWTVIFKTINKKRGGYLNYLRYLTNEKHSNHKAETHKIINGSKSIEDYFIANKRIMDEAHYKQIKNGKGGRPPMSFGCSVTINLPIYINDEKKLNKWKDKLLKQFYKDICKINDDVDYNNISYTKWKKLVFANFHIDKEAGSKTQLNLVIPHYLPFLKNKEITSKFWSKDEIKYTYDTKKIDISQKKYSYIMKKINNDITKKVLGLDILKYEFKNENLGKRKPKREYQNNKKEQELKQKEEKLKQREEDINKNEQELIKTKKVLEREIENFNNKVLDDETIKTYISRIEKQIKEKKSIIEIEKNMTKLKNRAKKVENYNLLM